jgi:ABC-type antimicrobial peptide transport system permease subunit
VLIEAGTIGLLSVGIGLLFGLSANHYFATTGLDYKALGGETIEASGVLLPDKFYAILSPEKVTWSTVVVVALVLLSAVYPAVHAARFQPAKAMHHV